MKYLQEKAGFTVDQEGEFLIYDAFHQPIETVSGRIVALVEGEKSFYAMIQTERGIRPGRLC